MIWVQITFIIDEEGVGSQGVLVIGDILQDVGKIDIYSNNSQQEVPKVTGFTDSHYQALEGEKHHKTIRNIIWLIILRGNRAFWDATQLNFISIPCWNMAKEDQQGFCCQPLSLISKFCVSDSDPEGY